MKADQVVVANQINEIYVKNLDRSVLREIIEPASRAYIRSWQMQNPVLQLEVIKVVFAWF